MSDYRKEEQSAKSQKSKNTSKRVGIFLFALSFILFGIAFVTPFLPFPTSAKVIIAPSLAVLGEVAFWIGGIIVGKELMKRYRKHLNPINWFKKSRDKNT